MASLRSGNFSMDLVNIDSSVAAAGTHRRLDRKWESVRGQRFDDRVRLIVHSMDNQPKTPFSRALPPASPAPSTARRQPARAPTWEQQKQILLDTVTKLANVVPKGTNSAGSFFEATVDIENVAGQKVLTTIRWFGYKDGSIVISTAFVP